MTFRRRFHTLLDQAPPTAEAIEFEGTWVTWGTIQAVSRSLDSALTARGLGSGARVGLVLENRPEHVAVLLSVLATDRTVVTFSALQPAQRLAADVARADVPVVVGTSRQLNGEGVRAAAGDALVLELHADHVEADGPILPATPLEGEVAPRVAIEMLTSGTTGPPKRVQLTEHQFAAALATGAPEPPRDGLFRSGITIVVTPMVHIGGFWSALSPLYAGRRICLLSRFELESWVAAVERHRPRATALVPAAIRAVLRADVPADKLASLEVMTSGTTFCPPELVDEMLERYGVRVLLTYGATEFAGAIALWTRRLHDKYWETKKGATGRPVPGVELRITGPDGAVLSAGERGILEVRSAQSPLGNDSWQRTSDLASLDEDGFLWIHGRVDDMIVRGGFKVAPETVREALESHPAVHEAAVAPLSDDRLGAVPVAAVEIEHDQRIPTQEELRAHCRSLLLPYEVPVNIVVMDALPRTPSHKVSRLDLLEHIKSVMGADAPA
jgi:long-chain acyl-CoA synthetase